MNETNIVQPNPEPNMEFVEFETKYSATDITLKNFQKLVEKLIPSTSYNYIEVFKGCDIYYTNEAGIIARHRFPTQGKGGLHQFTLKAKLNPGNNIVRDEINLDLKGSSNPPEKITKFCEMLGLVKNFEIMKDSFIYVMKDATLVFYSVEDSETKEVRNFIEIEVTEGYCATLAEAWEILLKYEKMLAPLGLTAQKRLKKSLWEMYKR